MAIARRDAPSVAGVAADLEGARAASRVARARLAPSVSANAFATTGSYGSIYPTSPRVDPAYNLLVPSGGLLDGNLMAMVPLATGGLLGGAARAAERLAAAAALELEEARAGAALEAEDAYFRVLLAGDLVAAEEAKAALGRELVRQARARFEAGKGIEADVRRAEAELARAERALAAANGEREKSLYALKATLALDLDSSVEVGGAFPEAAETPLAEFDAASANRPLVLAARRRLESAEAEASGMNGATKPQIYGVAMADGASRTGMSGASVGIVLSVPLLDGGLRRAETSRARAAAARAAADVRGVEIAVRRDVRQAFVDRATARANVESAVRSVSAAEEAYRVTSLRVENGKAILVEALDALEALRRARADLAQARYDRAIADARLRRAAGLPLAEVPK